MKTFKRIQRHSALAALGVLAGIFTQFSVPSAWAATYYWDNNSTTAGFGTAGGTWGTDSLWSTNAAGGASTIFTNTTVSGDIVNFGTATLPLAAGTVTVSGSVTNTTLNIATNSRITLSSGGTIVLAGTTPSINASASNCVINSAILLQANATINGPNVPGNGTIAVPLTLGGAISGAFNVTFNSPQNNNAYDTINLNAASTYTGTTLMTCSVNNSELFVNLGIDNALPTTTVLTLNGTAGSGSGRSVQVDLKGHNQTLAGLASTSGLNLRSEIVTSASAATLTVSNTSSTTFGFGGTNGQIQGSVALTKQGGADLTLGGNNNYSGATTISGGRIIINVSGALSANTSVIQTNSGALYINAAGTYNRPMNISTTGYSETGGNLNTDGAIRLDPSCTLSGTITLSGNSRIGNYIATTAGITTNTISGQISGAFGIDFYGLNGNNTVSHIFALSNPGNNYTGNTTIYNQDFQTAGWTGSSTTLRMGAAGVIPNGASAGNVVFNGADANHLTSLDLFGNNQTINGTTVAAAAGAQITNSVGSAATLTIGANDTTSTFSGAIADGGSGNLNVTKIGAGTLTLSGVNTYSGGTTLNASSGTLQIGGAGQLGGGSYPGAVSIGASSTFQYSSSASQTLSGGVSGSGALIKDTGAGTLTISGTVSYGGATTVSAGKLVVPSTHSGTGAATIGANAALGVTASGTSQWQPASVSLANPCTLEFNSVQNPGTTTAPLLPSASVGTVSGVAVNVNSISGAALPGNSYPLLGNGDGTTNGYTLGTQPPGFLGHLAVNGSTLLYVVDLVPDIWVGTDGTNPTWWDIGTSLNWSGKAAGNTPAGSYADGDDVFFDDAASPASPVSVSIQTAVAPASVIFNNNAKNYTVTASGANVIGGTGGLSLRGSGTVVLAGGVHTFSGPTTISSGTLQLGDGTSGNDATIASTSGVTNNGSLVFNRFGSVSAGYAISGTGSVTKQGAGTQTLSGANTYNGGTTVSAGTLQLGAVNALPGNTSAGDVTVSGTLDLNTYSDAINGLNGSGTLDTVAGGTPTLTVGANGNGGSFGGVIQNTAGTLALTKSGAGTQTLSGANTYSGQTSVAGGSLNFSATSNLGDGGAANTIALYGGGRLVQTGASALDLGANRSIAVGAGGGTLAHNSATAASITFSGNLTGTDPLSFQSLAAGGGTFILSGTNSGYTGNISVGSQSTGISTLRINASNAVPGGGSITLNYPANGASGNATTLNLQTNVSLPTGVTLNMTSFLNGSISLRSQIISAGAASVDGPITVSGDSIVQFVPPSGSTLTLNGNSTVNGTFTGTYFVRGVGNGVLNGTINIPTASFAKTDAGTWTVNSTGNDWSATQVAVGTLKIGANNALDPSAALTMGQGDANTATFDLNGFNQTVAGLLHNVGASGLRQIANSSGTLSALTVDTATNYTYGTGSIAILAGNLALVKQGSGTQTLSGANTYTGSTTISAGTLALSGSGNIGSSTLITVAGNAKFDVSAKTTAFTLGGNQTLSNSAPGAILSGTNNCSTGTLSLVYDGVNPCFIQTNGGMRLSASTVIKVNNTGAPLAGGTTNILILAAVGTSPGLVAGTLPAVTVTGSGVLAGGGAWLMIDSFNNLDLVTTSPSAWTGASDVNWTNGGNWLAGVSPGAGGVALFNSSSTQNLATVLNTNFNLYSLTVTTPTGPVSIDGSGGANSLTINNGIDMSGASQPLAITAPVVLGVSQTWTVTNASSLNVSGAVSGSAGLTVNGGGTVLLSGTNTYTGATTVSGGELDITNWGVGTLGTITVGNTAATSTLGISGGTLSLGANSVIVGTTTPSAVGIVNQTGGTVSFGSGNALLVGNTSGTSGTYNLSGGTLTSFASTARGVMLGVNNNNTATFNLSGTGNLALTNAELAVGRNDSAVTNCTVAFNQTGGSATVGNLSVGGQSGATTTTATFSLTGGSFTATNFQNLAAAASSSATLYLGGGAQVTLPAFPMRVGTATLTFDFTSGWLAPLAASANYLTNLTTAYLTTNGANFNVGSGMDITVAQVLQNAPSQAGKLTKSGPGKLTLSGANTYSGATTISAGTLALANDSAINASASLSIAAGATLDTVALTVPPPATIPLTASGIGTSVGTTAAAIIGVSGFPHDLSSRPLILNFDGSNPALYLAAGILNLNNNPFTINGAALANGVYTIIAQSDAPAMTGSVASSTVGGTALTGKIGTVSLSANTVVLTVSNAGPSGPGTITNSYSGGVLSLSWPAGQGWRLQAQTNSLSAGLSANWTYVTDGSVSSTNITVDSTKPTVFYRLKYP